MSSFIQDLKLSARLLRRRPAFALTAVLTLAVGMGVNTVAFTVVNGVLFKGSARSVSDDVGRIDTTPGGDEAAYASLAEYQRFADATRGVVDLAAEGRLTVAWRHDGQTETAWALFVSSNYFTQVTARPIAGSLEVGRRAGVPVAVIGERFWRRQLNSASLAGLELRLNGISVGVSGILPETFTGPAGLYSPDVWLALEDAALYRTAPALQKRDTRWLFLFGRLQPGVTAAEVQGRVDAAAAAMARDWPETHAQRGARFRMRKDSNSEIRGLRKASAIALAVIGLVLLLACFNVTNLLLARAVERRRDMAIRSAMGAGTWRLMRLVAAEGLLIAALAGVLALVIAWWTQALVGSFAIPIEQPQHIDLTPDARVLLYVLGLIVIAGVIPGVWPALSAARVDVAEVLVAQGGTSVGGRPSRMRRWLVAAQIAGSTAFLVIAALLAQSYGKIAGVDTGFDRHHLILAEFSPSSHGYDATRARHYADAVRARVGGIPGVVAVAVAHRAPFFIGYDVRTAVTPAGRPCTAIDCATYATMAVGPGYFNALGATLASGREFGESNAPEVIVNQPLAALLWPDGGALGESVRLADRGEMATVVGITGHTRTRGLDRERPTLYVPLSAAHYEGGLTLIARTALPPEPLVRSVVDASHAVDADVAVLAKTMEQRMAVQLWPFRTGSWVFSICGLLALVLGTVGLAAVVIHAVNRRLREFGVRLSLGATRRDLVAEVLTGSGRLLLPGLIAGTLLAAAIARLLQAAFVGVNVLNPVAYLAVAAIECATVAVACLGPALRASRVDPVIALRAE